MSANTAIRKSSYEVVVLHGSPHRDSYTERLTAVYLDTLSPEHVHHIDLFHADIHPCTDCKYCHTHNGCPAEDDFSAIADAVDNAQCLILSTPIYYLGFPAPVKAFCDRTQQLFVRRILHKRESIVHDKKKGVLICTCGSSDLSAVQGMQPPARMLFSVFGAALDETVYLAGTDLPPSQQQCSHPDLLKRRR